MYIKSWKKKKKLCKTSQKFALLAQSISNGAFSITCSNRFLHFCCCCVTLVVSDSVWPQRRQPTGLLCPWDSPGKNTGVGCHFLLQCTKVKSESEVVQSCPTLSDPMDCSLPGSSTHGIFQARVLEWGAIAFSFCISVALNVSWNSGLRW